MSENGKGIDKGLSSLGLFIMIGLLGAAYMGSDALVDIKRGNQTIRVKGFAEKAIRSDLAVWTGTYGAQSPDIVAAYERLTSDREKVLAFLRQAGVQDSMLDLKPVTTITQYGRDENGYQTNEIEGYRLLQTVEVTTTDIDLATRISKESSSLIQQGIGFESNPPSYNYTQLEDLKLSLLEAAAADAQNRAKALGEKTGAKVGALRSASQGVFQITAPNVTEVSDYGYSDTSTIDKAVKAVVTMEFAIE